MRDKQASKESNASRSCHGSLFEEQIKKPCMHAKIPRKWREKRIQEEDGPFQKGMIFSQRPENRVERQGT